MMAMGALRDAAQEDMPISCRKLEIGTSSPAVRY
jgi:hypothetical protein